MIIIATLRLSTIPTQTAIVKVNRIKKVRQATGVGLKKAKDFVEACNDTGAAMSFRCTAEQFGVLYALFFNEYYNGEPSLKFRRYEEDNSFEFDFARAS